VQVELDDGPDELGRERELRRQRLGEGGEVGSFVVLEAAGPENSAQVWVLGDWPPARVAAMAASNGSPEIVRMLLEAGADVDVKAPPPGGLTAMDYAYTSRRFAAICPLLLRAGSELPKDRPIWPLISENPYLNRIKAAGGFKNYERAHLVALTQTLSPKLALPPELVRTVVEFYLHAGFYPFTPAA